MSTRRGMQCHRDESDARSALATAHAARSERHARDVLERVRDERRGRHAHRYVLAPDDDHDTARTQSRRDAVADLVTGLGLFPLIAMVWVAFRFVV